MRTILLIGASSDIGVSFIERYHEEYDCIIAHYNNTRSKLDVLKEKLQDKLHIFQANLLSEESVESMIKEIKTAGLYPEHIVHLPAQKCNNAKYHKIDWSIFQESIEISVRSLVVITQAFLPYMIKQKYGRIIIMLSFVNNNIPPKYCSHYIATKYMLLGLMKAMSVEYADKGITVNGISPAWIDTKYIENQPDIIRQQNIEDSPIGRLLQTSDIIPGIKFLLSDEASCINGNNMTISCGR